MSKIVLDNITSNYASTVQLNNLFDKVELHLNTKVLYRDPPDGEPNQMEANLDLNSYRILNLPLPVNPTDVVRLQDMEALLGTAGSVGVVPLVQPTVIADGVATAFSSPSTGGNYLAKSFFVHLDGVKQKDLNDYTFNQTNGNIEFVSPPPVGVNVDITFYQPSTITAAPTTADDVSYQSTNVREALDARTPTVGTLAELQGLGAAAANTIYEMTERTAGNKGGGLFIARTGDKSTQVAGDEVNVGLGNGGRWVAFGSDLTGASGAWERLEENYSVPIDTLWYGISTDTTSYATNPTLYDEIRTQNARVMQVVTDQVGFSNRRDIGMPSGRVSTNAWSVMVKRNVKYVGQGGSTVQNGSWISLADDVGIPWNSSGDKCQLLISSCYFISFHDISIVSIVAPSGSNDRQIVIKAEAAPLFSTSYPKFKDCFITALPSVTFQAVPILVYATKFFQSDGTLISYTNNDVGLQIGVDDVDEPDTLIKGSCEHFGFRATFFFCDVVLFNIRSMAIDEECQFDQLPSGNGGANLFCGGDQKAADIKVFASFLGVDDRGAAITQGTRVNSAQLLNASSWRVKSIFRDRLIGVDVTRGFINLDGSIFQTRAANTGTEIGVRIAEGAEQVSIGATTDFSVLHANNHIAVQDNRAEFHLLNTTGSTGAFPIGETVTGGTSGSTATVRGYNTTTNTVKTTIPSADFTVGELLTATPSGKTATLTFEFLSNERDGLVMSCELVKDYTLISTGSYETIITRRLASKLAGGVYSFNGSLSIRSNLASRYKVKVVVNGSDIGVAKALTMPISEDGAISFSKDVVLPSDTTTPSTITLQIQQETAGTAAVIRGDTTLGDSWLQVRRL